MSLIFHRFPTREHADKFALDMCVQRGLDAVVFADEESAFEHDPFPFDLEAPIVHVERTEDDREAAVIRSVIGYCGEFAGT